MTSSQSVHMTPPTPGAFWVKPHVLNERTEAGLLTLMLSSLCCSSLHTALCLSWLCANFPHTVHDVTQLHNTMWKGFYKEFSGGFI